MFFLWRSCIPRVLHSFPTRRSSDLEVSPDGKFFIDVAQTHDRPPISQVVEVASAKAVGELGRSDYSRLGPLGFRDRKSTRLNSSHMSISYAVFCLKKKKNRDYPTNC